MLAILFTHHHAGSVPPLHPKSSGVSSAGRDQWQTRVSGQAVLGQRALFLREGMEGGGSPTAHPVWGDDSHEKP